MKNNPLKKSLSVFLAVLMILSSWVWVPGEHNHASAAERVDTTVSLTAMAAIYNGSGDRAPTGKIVICGDGKAENTTVGVAKFNIASLPGNIATATLNLTIGNHGGSIPSSAKIYLINPDKCTDVTSKGQLINKIATVYGSSYTGTTGASNAYNYFGISESQSLGEIWQNQTGSKQIDVTAAVETAKANGWSDFCLAFIMPKTYGNDGSPNWSDIHIGTDANISCSYYNYNMQNFVISTIEELGAEVEYYENNVAGDVFYTNMENNYRAYNDAKRYYDSVVYGGVHFDAALASKYYSALHSHMYLNTGKNVTYINYLNQTITSRGTGETVNAAYRKNIIWYPWNFSYGFTQDGNWVTKKNIRYYWTIPNMVIGILDNDTTTFPYHGFFFSGSNNKGIRSIMIGEKNSNTSVDTQKFKFDNRSKVGSLTHQTGGFAAYGDNSFGDWSFENYASTNNISNATQKESDRFMFSKDTMYQVSNYATVNNTNLGVNASNFYVATPLDLYVTFHDTTMGINSKTEYVLAVEDHGEYGYAHAVYMQTYKDNYENWKTIFPNLSYKDYNGYVFASAPYIAGELDGASDLSMTHTFTSSDATASHNTVSAKVSAWATNINSGANHLKNAKTTGNSATRVTNKYVDLINAIKAADSIYANDQAKYTPATWSAFVSAYEAARAHMASLNPDASNVQYSSDATAIGNLATALANAQAALQYVTVTYIYYNGTVAKTISAANGEVLIGTTAAQLNEKAPANTANVSVDDTNHYTYSWPVFSNVTDSATYQETRGTQAHSLGGYVIDQAATCSVPGSKHKECENCNYKTAAETIPVTAHTPGAAATCTTAQLCTVCSVELVAAKGHNYTSEVTTSPTCTAEGVKTFTCSDCGDTYTEVISSTGHAPGAAATCTSAQICTVCGAEIMAKLPHTEIVIPAEEATCSATGLSEGKKCSVCDTVTVTQTVVPKKDHIEALREENRNEASCGSAGSYDLVTYCSVCGDVIRTEAQTIPATGAHSLGNWITDKEPTCITPGTKHRDCENCDYTENGTIEATGEHVYGKWTKNDAKTHMGQCEKDENCTQTITEAHIKSDIVKAYDSAYHYYKCEKCETYGDILNGAFTEHVKESCYGEGSTFEQIADNENQHKKICKCGNEKNDGHKWSGWVADPVNKDDNQGRMSNTCSECSYKKYTTCTYEATETVNASCTAAGHKIWKCTDCDNGYSEILPAINHENKVYHPKDPATCVKEGTIEYWSCPDCKKNFSDEACTTEVTELVIPKDDTNHVNKTEHKQTDATCLTVGYTAGVFCNDCKKWISGHEEIPATDHDYDTTKSESNLARPVLVDGVWTKGYYTYKCKNNPSHTTKEEVNRADYTEYETALKKLEELLKTDLTDEAREEINSAIEANNIDDDLISSEQNIVKVAVEALETVYEKNQGSFKSYTVKFVVDGVTVKTDVVVSGNSAVAPTDVTKASDENNHYTFDKWDIGFTGVTSDLTVTALFTSEAHNFTSHTDKDDSYHTDKCACGYKKDVEHSYNDGEITTEPTCTDKGEKTYTCSVCSGTKTEEVKENGHSYTFVVTPPTCTEQGYTTYTCSVCNTGYASDFVAPNDHTPGEAVQEDVKHATCYVEGSYNEVVYCSVAECHEKLSSTPKTIEKIAHTPGEAVQEDVKHATCYAEGSYNEVVYCSVEECHAELSSTPKTIEKIAHTPAEAVIENEVLATCDAMGSYEEVVYCSVDDCNAVISRTKKYTDKVSHNWDVWVSIGDGQHERVCKSFASHTEIASCYDADNDKYCDACGAYTVNCKHEFTTGNSDEDFVVVIEPTCYSTGSKSRRCILCDGYNTEEYIDIPMKQHNYTSVTVSATCTENGSVTYTCANDGCTSAAQGHSYVVVITAKGHSAIGDWIVEREATCTQTGLKFKRCNNCKDHAEEQIIEKLSHSFGAWTVVSEPNCITDGSKVRSCVCGETETAVIKATGVHNAVIIEGFEATCSKDGLTDGYYCSECDMTLEEQTVIPADESLHSDKNGDGECDECRTHIVVYDSCSCHSNNFISKIIRFFYTIISKIFGKRITCCPDMEFSF